MIAIFWLVCYQVILNPKPRSKRWISTSVPQSQQDSDLAKTASPDYHVNNMVSPVLFQEGLCQVPRNALLIEIAPHCLLQAILKRSVGPQARCVGLMKRDHADNINFFLSSLGRSVGEFLSVGVGGEGWGCVWNSCILC